jgi:Zn-finger nucleic acid-binding protein
LRDVGASGFSQPAMEESSMPIKKPSEEEEKWIKEQEIKKRKDEEDLALKKEHWMKCPNCGQDLQGASYPKLEHIKMKKCESCGGVWLDKGELDVIIQVEVESFAEKARDSLWKVTEQEGK